LNQTELLLVQDKASLLQPSKNLLQMLKMFLKGARIHNQIVHKIIDELVFKIAKQGINDTREYLTPYTYPHRQLVKLEQPKRGAKGSSLAALS
jgi:hypothetical protein